MFSLTTVQHPTRDCTKPQVMLLDPLSGKRVIFGAIPEGSQRVSSERSTRLSKLTKVFLTGTISWKSLSGLPGMILTVADQGCKQLDVYHGDSKVLHLAFATWRYFVFRFGLKIQLNDGSSNDKSAFFKFRTVNVTKPETLESGISVFDFKFLKGLVSKIFPLAGESNQTADDAAVKQELPKASRSNVSSNYIVKMNSLKRKYVPELVKKYGLKKEDFQSLAAGRPAILQDGTEITLESVTMPGRTFDNVLFLDIPEPDLVGPTMNVNWFEEASGLCDSEQRVKFQLVYHFIDINAMQDPLQDSEYVKFIQSFGPHCKHVISHPKYCMDTLNFESASVITLKLRSLDARSAPLPLFDSCCNSISMENIYPLTSGQTFKILPFGETEMEKIWELRSEKGEEYWEKLYDDYVEPFEGKLESREAVLGLEEHQREPNSSLKDSVEITVLGTGSALPNKYRNVISTMLRLPILGGSTRVILDAGENTLGTLCRMYSPEKLTSVFRELKVVYLSHLHADHLLGIYSIIQEWCKVQAKTGGNEELLVICPDRFQNFVREWNQIEPEHIDLDRVNFVDCASLLMNRELDQQTAALVNRFGIERAKTCLANHCDRAYCAVIDFRLEGQSGESDSFKVSYSGDTRPLEKFIALGKGSNLLIHEATLQDSLYLDAIKKKHSTISESLQVARLMECEKVVLTHFSQRYSKLPELETVDKDPTSDVALKESKLCQVHATADPVVFFAFDNMNVTFGNLASQMKTFKRLGFNKIGQFFDNDDEEPNKRQKV
ncbi:unnamed protein product [Kuraishia capsulata CBS 1993]|uniref:ribonuclease Z n=1 Tax=Kuraishia capsulata CBS 1993 TaxID=1382522 RepID=W6MPE8_9ASCO|nr:uncharacterized protein KUCA_T00004175001 [Kuraishia capsulata CBS 1993]CDK28193.1 unnamed protein product [Kuraishia capsulata CBS 1993]